jgi:hypothetical protein
MYVPLCVTTPGKRRLSSDVLGSARSTRGLRWVMPDEEGKNIIKVVAPSSSRANGRLRSTSAVTIRNR